MVEIPEAYRAVILKDVSFFSIFGSVAHWVVVHALNLFLKENCIDSNFVSIFHFLLVLLSDFIHDSHLFRDVTLYSLGQTLLIDFLS